MQPNIKSLRPFIGAKNIDESLQFYTALGWEPRLVTPNLYYVSIHNNFGFYLQDYYNTDWVNNTQVFVEIDDVETYYEHIASLQLPTQFEWVQLKPIQQADWGKEFFLTDPSTVLWHFGKFEE
jgi:hypothetical protein